jgi:hypothetical protein
LKAEVGFSSRSQKDFICREEKRKAARENAVGPENQWSHGSGWKFIFVTFFFYCPKVEMSLWCRQIFPGKEKYLLGLLSPFGTSCSLSFKSSLSMITLTAVRDRDDEVYTVTASC